MNPGWKKALVTTAPFVLLVALLLTRMAFAYTWRIDSDEPQHLHVIWGWANGLLQYRDIFDNHAPLFHLLFAPVYAFFGERPDILNIMRLATMPLFLLALWAVYLIGRELYSKPVGLWAALLTGLYPKFFLTSLEFRADDLWIVPWLLAIAVLARPRLKLPHLLIAGILLGASMGTSMKTSFLLIALGIAALMTLLLYRATAERPAAQYVYDGLALLAGVAAVPLALVLYFYADGALANMYYAVIQHNIVPDLGHWKRMQHPMLMLLWMVPTVAGAVWLLHRSSRESERRQRRMLVFLTFGLAMIWLYGVWPLVTRQDFLPLIPLAVVIIVGQVAETCLAGGYGTERRFRYAMIMLALAGVEFGWMMVKASDTQAEPISENRLLAETLQLTRPGDEVMDLKGETVFRPRPFFYVLEGVTRKRIELGMIADSIPEDIVRTHTTVAGPDSLVIPKRGRRFINQNFIPVGQLRVAGQWLAPQNGAMAFDIRISTSYAVVAEQGSVSGMLDGAPYTGPRQLDAGHHVFQPLTADNGRLAVIWAPAVERGFSPFAGRSTS